MRLHCKEQMVYGIELIADRAKRSVDHGGSRRRRPVHRGGAIDHILHQMLIDRIRTSCLRGPGPVLARWGSRRPAAGPAQGGALPQGGCTCATVAVSQSKNDLKMQS